MVEDLDLTFEVSLDKFGKREPYELIPGGADIAVTKSNVMDYVNKYVKFLLTDVVKNQFEGFSKGMKKIKSKQKSNNQSISWIFFTCLSLIYLFQISNFRFLSSDFRKSFEIIQT